MLGPAFLLLALSAGPCLAVPWSVDVVCDAAESFLAVLTKSHPYEVDFPAGKTADGQEYPAGTLTLTTLASHNCSSEHKDNKTIFQFGTSGGLRVTIPSYSLLGKNVKLVITASAVSLHVTYQLSDVNTSTLLSPLATSADVPGNVMVAVDDQPPTDWTNDEKVFIQPLIKKAFNDYINTYRFTVNHDLSIYGSVTSLIEAYLYSVHKSK